MLNGKYKITYVGDSDISNVHHIGVDYGGNYYSVIFGRYVNGGFCSIPNWEVGCELATMEDIFWNAGAIGKALEDAKAGKIIAKAIATYCSYI